MKGLTTETQGGPHASKAEILALTGLRAVAALAVVLSHTGLPASAPAPLHNAVGWGHVGVTLFFMLSGVVLAYNYPDLSLRDPRRTLRFFVARIARVMPLYWVVLLYCVARNAAIGHEQYPRAFVLDVLAVQTWGADLHTAQAAYNGPGWSIGVELFFYALFPLLLPIVVWLGRRFGTRGLVGVVLAGAVLSLSLWWWFHAQGRDALPAADGDSAHRWLYRHPVPRLIEFVVGIAVALLLPQARRLAGSWHHLLQAVVVGYVVLLAAFRPTPSAVVASGSYSAFWVLPFAVLLWSLASDRGWFARFLATPPLVALGTASYALYITHRWLPRQLTGAHIEQGGGLDPWVALVLTLVALLLVAEGAHRYVEVPCRSALLRLSSALARRWPTEMTRSSRSSVSTS